jgi:hypothetical protein
VIGTRASFDPVSRKVWSGLEVLCKILMRAFGEGHLTVKLSATLKAPFYVQLTLSLGCDFCNVCIQEASKTACPRLSGTVRNRNMERKKLVVTTVLRLNTFGKQEIGMCGG